MSLKSAFKYIVVKIITWEAKLIVRKYKPFVIGVTGSVGKTSTKDAIYTLLSGYVHVRKSDKSFNSEIGVPVTIIGCPNAWNSIVGWFMNIMHGLDVLFSEGSYPKYLVLELGTDRPGDIEDITRWLKLDIAVINKISEVPVHVEFFGGRDELVKEKKNLIKALKKDGTLILYGDSPEIREFKPENNQRVIHYGFDGGSLENSAKEVVLGSRYNITYSGDRPTGFEFQVDGMNLEFTGVVGIQNAYPFLAAYSVIKALNFDLSKIKEQTLKHKFPPGRMNILEGIKHSVIIDDTYNASPDATSAGLKVVEEIRSHSPLVQSGSGSSLMLKVGTYTSRIRSIVIIGDMMELGQHSVEAHEKVGIEIAKISPNLLITVGMRARKCAEGALSVVSGAVPGHTDLKSEDIISFSNSKEAADEIPHLIREHDVVYIKGSQFIRAERITKALLSEPAKAADLLVRQDEQWLLRD